MRLGIFRKLFQGQFNGYSLLKKIYFLKIGPWLRGFSGTFFLCLEIVSGKSSVWLPEFTKFPISFRILGFGKSFRKIPWVKIPKIYLYGLKKSWNTHQNHVEVHSSGEHYIYSLVQNRGFIGWPMRNGHYRNRFCYITTGFPVKKFWIQLKSITLFWINHFRSDLRSLPVQPMVTSGLIVKIQ